MLTITPKGVRPHTSVPAPQSGVGIVKGNPKRCLICEKEIKNRKRWMKYTSPSDPDLGAYSIIVHQNCKKKAR
jgi:hypothetical protein